MVQTLAEKYPEIRGVRNEMVSTISQELSVEGSAESSGDFETGEKLLSSGGSEFEPRTELEKIVALENGDLVTSYFEIAVPVTASFSSWKAFLRQARSEYFVLTYKYDDVTTFRLKGQMLWQPETRTVCFVGSPQLNSIAEANYLGLCLSDFSLHDPTKDTLFLNHATTTINCCSSSTNCVVGRVCCCSL